MWPITKKIIAGNGVNISVPQVKCQECKHYVDKIDAQEVLSNLSDQWFCPMHKKPYEKIQISGKINISYEWGYSHFIPDGKPNKYFITIPSHDQEVNEKGEEIKRK